MEPPWFEYKRNPAGSKIIQCGCIYLRDKLVAAGFSTHMAGVIWHRTELLERPRADGSGVEIITKAKFMRI